MTFLVSNVILGNKLESFERKFYMAISKKDVQYVADLARIKLDSDELTKLSLQLQDILEYINKLKNVDVTGVEPETHVLDLKNIFRSDLLTPSLPCQEVLRNSHQKEEGFFKIPKVIE